MSKTDSAALCFCASFAAMVLAGKTGHPVYFLLFGALCGGYGGRFAVLVVTREAFDAMDGYRRSNDSGGGGTL